MIKLFEMFAGYGGTSFALKKENINFECIGYSEIDKYAIKLYNQNFPNVKNYGDCTKIIPEEIPDFDLLTAGFPCQDVSIAGKRDLTKGRTTLFDDIIRIVKVKKPKYMLLENVKGLLSSPYFEYCKLKIKEIGYDCVIKVLNSKHYGVPQNRERVYFVCKLGYFDFNEFQFPLRQKLNLTLKSILEVNIDKKYYLKEEQIKKILTEINTSQEFLVEDFRYDENLRIRKNNMCPTLGTQGGGGLSNKPYIIKITDNKDKPTFKSENISYTLTGSGRNSGANQGVILSEKTRDIDKAINVAKELSNKNNTPIQLDLYHLQHGEIRPLTTYIPQDFDSHRCLQSSEPKEILIFKNEIRRLTPKECFRLQGFLNDEINLNNIPEGQLYKLAGNGFEINVVSKILKNLLKNDN